MKDSGPSDQIVTVGAAADRYLRGHSKLYVVPNMGNAGDALINHSAYSLLRKRNIPFTVVEAHDVSQVDSNGTYLLMVNGALHHGEHAMDRLIALLMKHGAKMIFHSATIQDRDDLLLRLPLTTVILAREKITFEYIRKVRPELINVLSEDASMAIRDGDADLPRPGILFRLQYRLRLLIKSLQFGYPVSFAFFPESYRNGTRHSEIFFALREDDERANDAPIVSGNVDISTVCGGKQTIEHAEASAWSLLRVIRSKRTVRTDRLHVSIGCALTGTECQFSANKYFKCEAIYKHSLAKNFPHVKWVVDTTPRESTLTPERAAAQC